MQTIADELAEAWVNGNRSYVLRQLREYAGGVSVALLGALIFAQLGQEDRTMFLGYLNRNLTENEG